MDTSIERVALYWFSGTGNTLLVAQAMADAFAEAGVDVALHRIEDTDPHDVRLDRTIGLAVPVAVGGNHPFVWEFVEGLPQADGTGVFLVDTLAGFSGGLVGPMRRILTRKGYRPLGAREIIMPDNLLCKTLDDEAHRRVREAGAQAARRFAADLIAGTSVWRSRFPLQVPIYKLNRSRLVWRMMRRHERLSVDEAKCTRCGLCEKLCPVGNITLAEERPQFGGNCQICMRCVCYCPTGAIRMAGKHRPPYRAVPAGDLLGEDRPPDADVGG